MGDRTHVELTVRKADVERHPDLLGDSELDWEDGSTQLVHSSYQDVNFANLGIEQELQRRRIPYDKSWNSGSEVEEGVEYCRVLATGEIVLKEFCGNDELSVNLDAVIEAYSNGDIETFLTQAKREREIMSWEDQLIIMDTRDISRAELVSFSAVELNTRLVAMMGTKSDGASGNDGEVPTDINSQEPDGLINHLLNNGYISADLSLHLLSPYELPKAQLPLIILPCTAEKADTAQPALTLYQGKGYIPLLRTAGAARPGVDYHLAFLSAKHGLIPADRVIEPYEQRLTTANVDTLVQDKERDARQLIQTLNPCRIVACLPKLYLEAFRSMVKDDSELPEISTPPAGAGIGAQRGFLADALSRCKLT